MIPSVRPKMKKNRKERKFTNGNEELGRFPAAGSKFFIATGSMDGGG